MKVSFYNQVSDDKLKFAVIVSRFQNQWVFCKHRQRITYEVPGGHREVNETIEQCAHRELYEETGAFVYRLIRVCDYGVSGESRFNQDSEISFGTLFFAEIEEFKELPESEIEQVYFFKTLPDDWTYPEIQPHLIDEVKRRISDVFV